MKLLKIELPDRKFLRKNDGAALITVIVVFVVLMIFLAALSSIFSSNLRQTKKQENKMKAYYLALSGADLAAAALQLPTDENIKNRVTTTLLESEFTVDNSKTEEIKLDGGKAKVTIESKKRSDGFRWVKITSVGILDGSGVQSTTSLSIRTDNLKIIERDSN